VRQRQENGLRLCLYVAGGAPNSRLARRHLLQFLGESAARSIEVVDVLEDPQRALRDNVLITPTLLKLSPPPIGRLVGNLSDPVLLESLLGPADGGPPGGDE